MKPSNPASRPTFEIERQDRERGRSYGHPYDKISEEKPLWRVLLGALTKRIHGKDGH